MAAAAFEGAWVGGAREGGTVLGSLRVAETRADDDDDDDDDNAAALD